MQTPIDIWQADEVQTVGTAERCDVCDCLIPPGAFLAHCGNQKACTPSCVDQLACNEIDWGDDCLSISEAIELRDRKDLDAEIASLKTTRLYQEASLLTTKINEAPKWREEE